MPRFIAFKRNLQKLKIYCLRISIRKPLQSRKSTNSLKFIKKTTKRLNKVKILTQNKKKTEIESCSYFTTVYVGSCLIRFQKRTASIFQKHNIILNRPTPAKNFLTTLATICMEVLDANVIYKYTCSADQNISYIRETSQQVFRRTIDHCKIDKNRAIFDYFFYFNHCQNSDIVQNF